MNQWTQIKINCATADLETVTAVMSMYDNALMIDDPNDVDRIETIYGELIDEGLIRAARERGSVSIFVPVERATPEYTHMIAEHLRSADLQTEMELVGRDEEEWRESWKQYYKPLALGEHLTVVPIWEKDTYRVQPEEKIVLMDPGVAFGSGTHETTRLCATLMERCLQPGDRVLDVGTGSGILAIAAAVLGAGEVKAYDLDPVAVRIAGENTEVNGVQDRVACGVSDLLADVQADPSYDLITANIVADIILRMAPDVARYLRPEGILIVSGIIDRQAEQVKEAICAQGFSIVECMVEHDWNAIAFRKKQL